MKKTIFSILSILITFGAYASYKKMHKSRKKKADTIKNDTNIKSVLMGRSACFGTCPSYTIEVFENGLLRYNGKSHVAKEGIYEKQVKQEDAIRFIREFNTLRPDTLHYMYPTMIADLPGIYYFISYPDSVKKVVNADSGPRILRDWAKKFDQFANIDSGWVKKASN